MAYHGDAGVEDDGGGHSVEDAEGVDEVLEFWGSVSWEVLRL